MKKRIINMFIITVSDIYKHLWAESSLHWPGFDSTGESMLIYSSKKVQSE